MENMTGGLAKPPNIKFIIINVDKPITITNSSITCVDCVFVQKFYAESYTRYKHSLYVQNTHTY